MTERNSLLCSNLAKNPTVPSFMLFAATSNCTLLPVSRYTCIATQKSRNCATDTTVNNLEERYSSKRTYLVRVRCHREDNRPISRDMKGTPRPDLSEEDGKNVLPAYEYSVVDQV